MGAEEGLAGGVLVLLVGFQHAVEPREVLLVAVVGVQDDGDAIGRGNGADVVGSRDGTLDHGLLLRDLEALAGEESRATARNLKNDGGLQVLGGLESRDGSGGGGDLQGSILASKRLNWAKQFI